MDTLIKNKKSVGALVIILLAFYLYSLFANSGETEPEVVGSQDEGLIEVANELSNISFRQDLFAKPGYKNLVDFSTTLTAQPTGRKNPFDIIGRD